MVNSFGCCRVDGRGALQSPNRWRSCKVQREMGEGEMEGNRSMVIEVEGAWNLDGMGILSCMRVGIGMLVSVLVLFVVLVWTVLMVWVVVRVLVVVMWREYWWKFIVWEWFLGQIVGVLWWWWCWRILHWCCGVARGWLCGVGMRGETF